MPRGTVNITRLDTLESRDILIDTSFPPLRREAFRRRSIQAMRDSLNTDNVAGAGTVATQGLWRREMVDFSGGAGQYSLDRKQDDDPTRFFSSKGIDVFTYPQRATLLPDTQQIIANAGTDLLISKCGDYLVVAAGGVVKAYDSSYSLIQTYSAGSTFGGTAYTIIYSITSNDSYCYIGTDTGIWFAPIGSSTQFQLYAAPDVYPYTYYSMVRWANDQLIAAAGPRLYAFQPRGGTGTPFGSPPSVSNPGASAVTINSINNSAGTATIITNTAHGLVVGQQFGITGTKNFAAVNSTPSLSGSTATIITVSDHGFVVGQQVTITLGFNGAPNGRTETVTILTVPSATHFTYTATKIHAAIIATGWTFGTVNGYQQSAGQGYCGNWTVATAPSSTTLTITAAQATFGTAAMGGQIANPSQNGTYAPDMLVQHENPNWVWSDATGGQTQVYFAGYVQALYFFMSPGAAHSGSIMRSDMLGSSTTQETGVQTITNTAAAQPWMLDVPVECLPMAPDEYPTCIQAYLNYIFVGTNRGIRMCQTLSIYDPTATSTGDLKSGPLIPNKLQPVLLPVTAIIGDGQYVWFTWNNYDGVSTGLGKLNLQQFIADDPLAPVYASDLMVTAQGTINSLDWDPVNSVPIMAVQGEGIYVPYATNEGGNLVATQFVPSGELVSSFFDYGIAEQKIPVFFDYGGYLNYSGSTPEGAIAATVVMDPESPTPVSITVPPMTAQSQDMVDQAIYQTEGSDDRAKKFQVTLTLTTSDTATAPYLYRWTLKAWPTVVQGTEVMIVAAVFRQNEVDGEIIDQDVEEMFNWLEALRWNQVLCTYTDSESSALGVITLIDDVADKPGGEEPITGFEGDFVITFQSLAAWVFTAADLS